MSMLASVIVKAVILNRRLKKILLIRRSTGDFGGGTWESAGGKVEEGETLENAVIREIFEETGLKVIPEKLLYASLDEREGQGLVFIVYLCLTDKESVILSGEHSESRWVSKRECRSMLEGRIAEDFVKHGVYDIRW